jgi:hypothetical protein
MGKKFPAFATILLVLGVTWLLNDLNIISLDLPWIPVILIILAISMLFNRFNN